MSDYSQLPKVHFNPVYQTFIHPNPDNGTHGLWVQCDNEGKIGLEIKGTDIRFVLSAEAARELASFIDRSPTYRVSTEFYLAS